MAKQRVFVSSVIEGFEEFREAARRGIVAAGREPVLVNEDFPSSSVSARTACLDAVASADVHLIVIGERGGWIAPSGLPVVEEEYEEARRRKKPILAFLQTVSRDPEAERLASGLSDYVHGHFRRTFTTPGQLEHEVLEALNNMPSERLNAPDWSTFYDDFARRRPISQETVLRVAIAPERNEEVINPVQFGSDELWHRLHELAHASDVRLLTYIYSKAQRTDRSWMILVQSGPRHRDDVNLELRIEERGLMLLDADLTGPTQAGAGPSSQDLRNAYLVDAAHIERILTSALGFYGKFLSHVDPYERHSAFSYNVSVVNLGYRRIVRSSSERSGNAMNVRDNKPLIAFSSPRAISRADLGAPNDEVARVLALLMRHASSN